MDRDALKTAIRSSTGADLARGVIALLNAEDTNDNVRGTFATLLRTGALDQARAVVLLEAIEGLAPMSADTPTLRRLREQLSEVEAQVTAKQADLQDLVGVVEHLKQGLGQLRADIGRTQAELARKKAEDWSGVLGSALAQVAVVLGEVNHGHV